VVAELDAAGPAQDLVMPLQLSVITAMARRLPLIGVDHGQHLAVSL